MKNLVILAIFISLIAFLMTLSVYFYYTNPISEFSYFSNAFVTRNTEGFDLNSSAITFGSLPVGGSSTRAIVVNNSYPFAIRVKPNVEGTISRIIDYEPITIQPYESSKLYFTVHAYSIDLIGNYTGNISVKLMRAYG